MARNYQRECNNAIWMEQQNQEFPIRMIQKEYLNGYPNLFLTTKEIVRNTFIRKKMIQGFDDSLLHNRNRRQKRENYLYQSLSGKGIIWQ